MGRGSNFACKTCKKDYFLGYGSYRTWLDRFDTVAAYDAFESENKNLGKNQNFRKVLSEHETHNWLMWYEDYYYERDGKLLEDGQYYGDDKVLIDDFGEYERIDLWGQG